ncbi:hypothetical protein ACTQ49_04045 [Luteococcus sp. Sow4_B9]|uniref:hypothetical protein n=1 Tax=Luteococcus sp. Sow4_B9 TaxID=3438792 RepID=UPI003F996FCD
MQPTPEWEASFATTLARAVSRRGLTLDRLSVRLRSMGTPVSIATLSYWQTGRSAPTRTRSLRAIENLETILEVPRGHLVGALPSDASATWDPTAAVHARPTLMGTLRSMGLDLERHSEAQMVKDSTVVHADRLTRRQRVHQLTCSQEDGWQRVPMVFGASDDTMVPTIEAGRGCTIGQVVELPDERELVVELILDRPLSRGELAMFDYTLHWASSEEWQSFERSIAARLPYLVLEVAFEGTPPRHASYVHAPRHDSSPDHQDWLALSTGRHIQHAMHQAAKGIHGLTWNW